MYESMMPLVALQNYDSQMIELQVVRSYTKLMDRLFDGLADLPVGDLTEIRYSELATNPMPILANVAGMAVILGHFQKGD